MQQALDAGVPDGITEKGTFVKDNDTYTDCTIIITWEKELQPDMQWHDVADTDEKEQTFTFENGTLIDGWAYQSE